VDQTELETAIDALILQSGLGASDVVDVLEGMTYRYKEEAAGARDDED
jgi:hypothetical protein